MPLQIGVLQRHTTVMGGLHSYLSTFFSASSNVFFTSASNLSCVYKCVYIWVGADLCTGACWFVWVLLHEYIKAHCLTNCVHHTAEQLFPPQSNIPCAARHDDCDETRALGTQYEVPPPKSRARFQS